MSKTKGIAWNEEDKIKELLMGKSVKKVADDQLLLSDGTHLTIYPNQGCGGCPAGNFYLEELNECENIITNVEFEEDEYQESFKVFVLAFEQRVNLFRVEGGMDNGYYGTGYWIEVKTDGN
jgi:hypothetical protein